MSILILHPEIAKESAEVLAKALKAKTENPFKTGNRDFRSYNLVINYGCNRKFVANNTLNTWEAVARCLDKRITLRRLARHNINHPSFVLEKEEIPKWWDTVVVRQDAKGNQAKSLKYIDQGDVIPIAELYTEYYHHKHEFRIMVFKGEIAGRYLKQEEAGDWHFVHLEEEGFEAIDAACLKAAAVLGIDLVGFDIIAKNQKQFVILEANTGCVLTPEVTKYIKEKLA